MVLDLSVEMRSDPKLLCASRAMLRQYLERMGFENSRCDEIVLAVDEGVTNAIRHGYGGRTSEFVTLRMSSDDRWVELEIVDGGACAPPDKVARKELQSPSDDELTPGGLGVQLMYEVCDEVRFETCADNGNHVRMRIRRPASAEETGADSGKDR